MMTFSKRSKILSCSIGATLFPAVWQAAAAERPNIVVIMADDLGWNAVSWHNRNVKTPNIDARIRQQGVELDQFYTSPMCSPTRAGFITGRYPIRYGCARAVIPPWRTFGLPTSEVTLAEAFQKAGYTHRGMFGKWHLGHARKEWHPCSRGFTDFTGCLNGAIDYFTLERDGGYDWHRNESPLYVKGYATELIGDASCEFIRNAAADDSPFFCYVAFNAPHSPFQVPERYKKMYAQIDDEKKQVYFGMITCMDDQIGRILDTLDETGAAKDTVVLFFSDNGGVLSIKGNNKPLRGHKLTSYQGGVRTVACGRFPGRWPAGQLVSERVAFIDLFPTLISLAGITPEQAGCKPLDGVDLNDLLCKNVPRLPERSLYFYHGQPGPDEEWYAVISKDWKLVVSGPDISSGPSDKDHVELFRISSDAAEKKDVAMAHPEVTEQLMKDLIAFRRLQPADAVAPYKDGRAGFVAPKIWGE
ncbi:MAG: sulfatase-like hydrolase/transferase [Kiritimatiellales bacterium]